MDFATVIFVIYRIYYHSEIGFGKQLSQTGQYGNLIFHVEYVILT